MKRNNKVLIVALLILLLGCAEEEAQQVDYLIKGASILDGTGKEAFVGSVAVNADTIVWVGKSENIVFTAAETIDASGYTLAPGFIDPHTHALADLSSPERKRNANYLFQGVTTVLVGNDGRGPIAVDSLLQHWKAQGIGTNAGIMVGHGTIRETVMGMSDAVPTDDELEKMKSLVASAMEEGAFGLSTGLYYTPGNFAATEEVIALAKVAAEKGGVYDSHIRDESSYSVGLLASVEEVIHIAEEANIHANVSHIKALGADVWGKSKEVIALIEKAQQEGLSISADQYPYRASGTRLRNALVPRWVFANNFQANFNNPALQDTIRVAMADNLRRRGGAESILFTDAKQNEIYNKTLAQVAEEREQDVIQTAIDIINQGSTRIASFNMKEEDIKNYMVQSWVTTSSDGSTGHPRKYGSFPKKIREYVIEKEYISLEEMIRKSTSQTAANFNIGRRGEIKVGNYADIILFKPEQVKDKATFAQPEQLAEGMYYVFVNGKPIMIEGKSTGGLYGIGLKR